MPRYVYIAGPISKGNQFVNVRNAVLLGEELRQRGLVPFVPHLSGLWEMIAPVPYEGWMELDFAWILRCDALLRMPGESDGADREVAFALTHSIPVFTSVEALLRGVGA